MTKEELKQIIIKMFNSIPHPGKNNIIGHKCAECYGVKKDFKDINWRDASEEVIEKNYDKLPLFSPAAFHHFLPAFLIKSIDEPQSSVCEYTIYGLFSDQAEWYSLRMAQFT